MNKILLLAFFLPLTAIAQNPTVTTCDGRQIDLDGVTVTSDSGTLNTSGCTYIPGNLVGYLNCIAAANNIPAGSTYDVDLAKPGDYLNGVSTLDLVLISRHIMQLEAFDEGCQTVAADVNGDNKVNLIDLIELRRLILGITTTLDVPSWTFYNSNDLTTSGIGPATDLRYATEDFPMSNLSIIGVKKGDVNNSVAVK